MTIGSTLISMGMVAVTSVLIAAIGIVFWFLLRIKQDRFWFPALRLITQDSKQLPKFTLKKPSLIPFLCFLVCCLSFIFLSFQPKLLQQVAFDSQRSRIHLLADFSPSVSGGIHISDYRKKLKDFWQQYEKNSRLSISFSHSDEVFEPKGLKELEEILLSKNYHKEGVKLASVVAKQLQNYGDIDMLLVFSDDKQSTWEGFYWQYLKDKMQVYRYPLNVNSDKQNVFFADARYVSTKHSKKMEWEIELQRVNGSGVLSGTINVSYNEIELFSQKWTITSGKNKVLINASWPITKLNSKGNGDLGLEWSFVLDKEDQILLDNTFKTSLRGVKKNLLVVNEITGENFLEDPTHDTESILTVMGYELDRFDSKNPVPSSSKYPLSLVFAGGNSDVDTLCPSQFFSNNKKEGNTDKIWLIPQGAKANYNQLCTCVSKLINQKKVWEEPVYCIDSVDRSNFSNVLKSLGGSQVGGAVGRSDQSLAWMFKSKDKKKELLVFTVPLTPRGAMGIGYVRLPLVLKDLLRWQGVLGESSKLQQWPRIKDITFLWTKQLEGQKKSNVPFHESTMEKFSGDSLPSPLGLDLAGNPMDKLIKKDKENPLPWIYGVAILMSLAMLIELIFGFKSLSRNQIQKAGVLFLVFMSMSEEAKSTEINGLGQQMNTYSFQGLKKEIEGRTSIEFGEKGQFFAGVSKDSMATPWLWVQDLGLITTGQGRLKQKIAYWLKKGGMLILQGKYSKLQLQKMTEGHFTTTRNQKQWNIMPPDHEMMRSFYLIDSLPSCDEFYWYQFYFDRRTAIVVIPFNLIDQVSDRPDSLSCLSGFPKEMKIRIFINLLMASTTTDYKKDQIHLPEILKRLR